MRCKPTTSHRQHAQRGVSGRSVGCEASGAARALGLLTWIPDVVALPLARFSHTGDAATGHVAAFTHRRGYAPRAGCQVC